MDVLLPTSPHEPDVLRTRRHRSRLHEHVSLQPRGTECVRLEDSYCVQHLNDDDRVLEPTVYGEWVVVVVVVDFRENISESLKILDFHAVSDFSPYQGFPEK